MKLDSHERLLKKLNNKEKLRIYKEKYDNYKTGIFPRIISNFLFGTVDILYGFKPSIQKFKVIEVVARVPYETWEFVNYFLITSFFNNEDKAIKYSKIANFGKFSQDNETMHVVVISQICKNENKGNWFSHTLVPIILAYIYFFISTILYIFSKKASYELNYLFENHAYNQYSKYILENKDKLKNKKFNSKYLEYYGRKINNELDLFISIRNDEIIHRNKSIEYIIFNK